MLASTTMPEQAVVAGSPVVITCTLSVVADYEWDAFGLPDVRGDWLVDQVQADAGANYLLDLKPTRPGR